MNKIANSILSAAAACTVLTGCCINGSNANGNNPNAYIGSDSERIEKALGYAVKNGMPLEITARKGNCDSERNYWLIDRAIELPENMEMQIVDCKIKLADSCRDNIIRSANCVRGTEPIKKIRNIRIRGIGNAVLEGASKPRSTGDSGKQLGVRTFGSDAGKEGECQNGDWRNIGVLLVDVSDFEISNIKVYDSHCWAISLEYCTKGKVKDVEFRSLGFMLIDQTPQQVLNQDGLDLRRGCQYIDIENIYGWTGDDLVALTAIGAGAENPAAGRLNSTMFSAAQRRGAEDDLHHVNIRNVRGFSAGKHHIVRLLNNRNVKMYDVTIDGVKDCSTYNSMNKAAVKIGDKNYGGYAPIGDTYNIKVRNVTTATECGVLIQGSLADSVIENVQQIYPQRPTMTIVSGMEYLRNVKFPENIKKAEGEKLIYFKK